MLAIDQIARNLSGKIGKSVRELYSASNNNTLGESDIHNIESELTRMSSYPIYYIDKSVTVDSFEFYVKEFMREKDLVNKQEGLIVTLDHSLLVEKTGEQKTDKDVIDSLYKRLITLKRESAEMGWKIMFIISNQLNRDIESKERVTKPALHYPTRNDLFGASSSYHSSDYVIVIHKPAIVEGIGDSYGPVRASTGTALPVFHPEYKVPMVYLHVIKNRIDTTKILSMLDDFKNSRILEVNL